LPSSAPNPWFYIVQLPSGARAATAGARAAQHSVLYPFGSRQFPAPSFQFPVLSSLFHSPSPAAGTTNQTCSVALLVSKLECLG